ncbi:MAG: YjfB family protein [Peptostreptococcaceae bacterium]|jgi:Trp operon repressor|nr:YjfB family protein [Peptostreptococcaceae bacterium]
MDIAALSMALSQSKVQNQVGVSVMKIAMGKSSVGPSKGEQMLSLVKDMELSVNPNIGSKLDIKG